MRLMPCVLGSLDQDRKLSLEVGLGLHRLLQPDCARLFKDGHLNEAVRKALEKYETYVQQTSALSKIGVDLMANAFNERRRTIHSC